MISDILSNFIYFYHSDILWHNEKIFYIPKYLKKAFNNYNIKGVDFIFINLGIINQNTNHANILIFDKDNNSVERFDPYGDWKTNNIDKLDQTLEKLFKKIINKKIKYIKPSDYLIANSFQSISNEDNKFIKRFGDPDGFCLAWCYWYLELRLNNKGIDQKLVEKAIKKINKTQDSFLIHIRNYANNIAKFKLKELTNVGFDEHLLHNQFLNDKTIKEIYDKYINKKIIQVIK